MKLHPFAVPAHLADIGGYILQAWLMLWGDNFTLPTGAEYLMMFDSDSVLAMPVTCASLFDDDGRLYQQSWDIHEQKQFVPNCLDFIGKKRRVVHYRFSDGLSVLSLFQGPARTRMNWKSLGAP